MREKLRSGRAAGQKCLWATVALRNRVYARQTADALLMMMFCGRRTVIDGCRRVAKKSDHIMIGDSLPASAFAPTICSAMLKLALSRAANPGEHQFPRVSARSPTFVRRISLHEGPALRAVILGFPVAPHCAAIRTAECADGDADRLRNSAPLGIDYAQRKMTGSVGCITHQREAVDAE